MVNSGTFDNTRTDTRESILSVAQTLAQRRGFNGFSYADIAGTVGIRKASIHYYFPSKDDLELALLTRYNQHFAASLASIDSLHVSYVDRFRAYGNLYRSTLEAGGICLCGMMASDILTLPDSLRAPLSVFFTEHTLWLSSLLESGRRSGEFIFGGTSIQRAQTTFASLQGGLVLAHAMRDVELFDNLVNDLLSGVGIR